MGYDGNDNDDKPDPYTCRFCGDPVELDHTCDCIDDSDRNYLHPRNRLKYNKVLVYDYGYARTYLPKEDL